MSVTIEDIAFDYFLFECYGQIWLSKWLRILTVAKKVSVVILLSLLVDVPFVLFTRRGYKKDQNAG